MFCLRFKQNDKEVKKNTTLSGKVQHPIEKNHKQRENRLLYFIIIIIKRNALCLI
jgi:hypothetical protein